MALTDVENSSSEVENLPTDTPAESDSLLAPRKPHDEPGSSTSDDAVIVIKRTTFNYAVIALVFLIVGVVIGSQLPIDATGDSLTAAMVSTSVAEAIAGAGFVRASPTPGPIDVSIDDDPSWGPKDAPVVMVEFSDFECPFCSRFYTETYKQIKETYGDQIHFVYRDTPLPELHPNAIAAAQAAECADEQGAFWDYHDLLFENQQALQQNDFIRYATQLELDVDQFTDCVKTAKYADEVNRDMNEAFNYGVRGTPTFFINGRAVVGAQPYTEFAAIINEELAKASQSEATEVPSA
jgi:protein-disulfide isomerase